MTFILIISGICIITIIALVYIAAELMEGPASNNGGWSQDKKNKWLIQSRLDHYKK
jgi:hypothetical protein